jgi:hypothetical protein
MALTFFWRCEATTLAGDDYSAGDTTATASGTPTIAAGGARVGTNGIVTTDASDWYYFDPTSIAATDVGSAAFSIQFPSSVPGSGYDYGISIIDAGGTNYLKTRTAGAASGFGFRSAKAGVTNTVSTTGITIDAATWYGVVIRWDFPNDLMRIEVYDAAGSLLGYAEDSASDTSDYEPTGPFASFGLRIGNLSTQTNVVYIDNVFVSDAYAEPLQNNLTITAYSSYDSGATTRYVKLLALADAASATGVEGVVLNAARDTVIGEFTGQAFEASLESGEAVLLIDVADIIPDGSTLTTLDTPIVFAYNSTDGTVGEGSATVIEV